MRLRIFRLLAQTAIFTLLVRGAVSAFWYGLAVKDQWGTTAADRIDFVTDTIKMTLHTSTYTPNQDTHRYYTDLTNELTTAGGYTAGGATLAGKALTYDGPTNTVRFTATAVTWTTATFTARYAVLRKDTGTSATSHLMGYTDFGADQAPAGVDFTVQGDPTDGFLRAVVS